MPDECRLQVARRTAEDGTVIDILEKVDREFWYGFGYTVITSVGAEQIKRATTRGDVLHIVRTVTTFTSFVQIVLQTHRSSF